MAAKLFVLPELELRVMFHVRRKIGKNFSKFTT